MYNPPPPSGSGSNNNYYRQPSSTPGVGNPNPQANAFLPPQPQAGGYPQGPPPPQAGGYPQGPPPPQAGGYPQGPPPPPTSGAGTYNMPPPPPTSGAGTYGMPPPPQSTGGVSLVKNQQVSLTKEDPNLRKLTIGLGWDVNSTPTAPFDLDASVFMLTAQGRVRNSGDFIFYNNKQARDGSVCHMGDNLTGQGEGDDEVIQVNLQLVAPDISRLVFAVSIHMPDERRQNFSMVPRAFIRVINQETGRVICRYDITAEGGNNTALITGEVYRDPSNPQHWSFIAVGKGFPGGLQNLMPMFGVQ